ncbi:YdcF family protein [Mycolicibacterium fluoranthenivorans]|jgi:hypothetical protein|uniref:YdcF family protein n=1 Tax=Mycolicibacterium fluoranthenivorans TaxID=258505 RepID=A0A7G8PLH4_9MYCO|nr:YdcF family protein [Mycolicibacterium fluoranthenivorans]QNJ95190.1 YdcF family protein [Mycolicibacterium fluoranthenivorans]
MATGRISVLVALAAVFGGAEWATWKASRDLTAGSPRPAVPGETILVLGCPIPPLWKWRVRIAVRSTDPCTAVFVFSGGAVRTPVSESRMMADYAIDRLGVPAGNVLIEDQSRTTVQNVVNSIPLMTDSPAIKIASNTFHARRARQILRDESPELAQRLKPARDYLPAEWGPLHAVLLAYHLYRDRRAN